MRHSAEPPRPRQRSRRRWQLRKTMAVNSGYEVECWATSGHDACKILRVCGRATRQWPHQIRRSSSERCGSIPCGLRWRRRRLRAERCMQTTRMWANASLSVCGLRRKAMTWRPFKGSGISSPRLCSARIGGASCLWMNGPAGLNSLCRRSSGRLAMIIAFRSHPQLPRARRRQHRQDEHSQEQEERSRPHPTSLQKPAHKD